MAYKEKQSGGNGNGGSKGHFMQRLKVTVKSAVRLEEMALKAADQKTITEATAYAAWMKGILSLEKSDHQSVFMHLVNRLRSVGILVLLMSMIAPRMFHNWR